MILDAILDGIKVRFAYDDVSKKILIYREEVLLVIIDPNNYELYLSQDEILSDFSISNIKHEIDHLIGSSDYSIFPLFENIDFSGVYSGEEGKHHTPCYINFRNRSIYLFNSDKEYIFDIDFEVSILSFSYWRILQDGTKSMDHLMWGVILLGNDIVKNRIVYKGDADFNREFYENEIIKED